MSLGDYIRAINWNRILSGLIAIAYLVAGYLFDGSAGVIRIIVFLVLPIACIWYGEYMGAITGSTTAFLSGGPAVTEESPGCAVILGGWLLLLLPAIVFIIIRSQQ